MVPIVVAASISCFMLGGLAGLLGMGLLKRTCRSCEWRQHFADLEPSPDPVVHRKFLERVYDALLDLPIYHHNRIPGYDCPARQDAILHNEVAALLGRQPPYDLREGQRTP